MATLTTRRQQPFTHLLRWEVVEPALQVVCVQTRLQAAMPQLPDVMRRTLRRRDDVVKRILQGGGYVVRALMLKQPSTKRKCSARLTCVQLTQQRHCNLSSSQVSTCCYVQRSDKRKLYRIRTYKTDQLPQRSELTWYHE